MISTEYRKTLDTPAASRHTCSRKRLEILESEDIFRIYASGGKAFGIYAGIWASQFFAARARVRELNEKLHKEE